MNYWVRYPKSKTLRTRCFYLFDIDQTLCTYKNGRHPKFPEKIKHNWTFFHESIPDKINGLLESGYNVGFITNQSNFNAIKEHQLEELYDVFCNNIFIFAALCKNHYRKPHFTSIEVLCAFYDILPDNITELHYCGDALNHEGETYPPYLYSDVDYKFFKNIESNLPNTKCILHRPVDFFGSNYDSFTPMTTCVDCYLLMGVPGSGKTGLARRIESHGYVRYSQDEKGDLQRKKCIKEMECQLNSGNKIVIDATHARYEKRKTFIDLAHRLGKNIHILWLLRDGRSFNELRTDGKVPEVAYATYTKYFSSPEKDNVFVDTIF